jgi:excisionase family DNA binding protein
MPSETITDLITVQDAAKFLSISVSTLYGWVFQRRIPFVKVGRALRFVRADLEDFVASHRIAARTELRANGTRFAYNTRAAGKG